MACNYSMVQLTDPTVGAVATGAFIPLGAPTRRICPCQGDRPCFEVTSTLSDTVTINRTGYYRISYTGSLVAGAVGDVDVTLLVNGTTPITASQTVAAVGDTANVTLVYMIRVLPNCASVVTNVPVTIQLLNAGVALTGGQSNLLIEKVY